MTSFSALLDFLVCPGCKRKLSCPPESGGVVCTSCSLAYPVREGTPVLIREEALRYPPEENLMAKSKKSLPVAHFKIVEGPNQSEEIKVPFGSCLAIGRSVEDLNKTQMVPLDATLSLDDFTKKLVLNYLAKKGGAPAIASSSENQKSLGNFERLPDLVLNDPAVSRLHAMIFHDDSGAGILDLVSRNGTYVNGQEVESATLKEGDLVDLGSTKILLSLKTVA